MRAARAKKRILAVLLLAVTLAVVVCTAFLHARKAPTVVHAAPKFWKQNREGQLSEETLLAYEKTWGITTFGRYQKRNTISPRTLLIGTWLIDFDGFTDASYEMARDSMSNYDQPVMYYNSELADEKGAWRDISGAGSLQSITTKGLPVDEDEMKDLWITCVVDRGGLVVNPVNGLPINPFDILDPYDPSNLPELRTMTELHDQYIDWYNEDMDRLDYLNSVRQEITITEDGVDENGNATDAQKYVEKMVEYALVMYVMDNPDRYTDEDDVKDLWIAYSSGDREELREILEDDLRYEENGNDYRLDASDIVLDRSHLMEFESLKCNDIRNEHRALTDAVLFGPASETGSFGIGGGAYGTYERDVESGGFNEGYYYLRRRTGQDEETDRLDRQLDHLFILYSEAAANAMTDEASVLLSLMEAVDADRRAREYQWLAVEGTDGKKPTDRAGNVPRLSTLLSMIMDGKGYFDNAGGNTFVPDSSYTDAINEAIVNCQSSYLKYKQRTLSEGTTLLSEMRYEWSRSLVEAEDALSDSSRLLCANLTDLDNIMGTMPVNVERELKLIDQLIGEEDLRVQSGLTAQPSEEYARLQGEGAAEKLLKEALTAQKGELNAEFSTLQLLTKAKVIRLPKNDGIDFIKQRISWAEAQRATIGHSDFEGYADEALESHITWLKKLLDDTLAGSTGDDTLDDLNAKLADMEADYMDLLDEGDLDGADKQKKDIDDLKDQINGRGNELGDAAGDGDAGDQALALGTDAEKKLADDIGRDALLDIGDDKFENIPRDIEALKYLDGEDELRKIKEALELHGANPGLITRVQDALDELGRDGSSRRGQDGEGSNGEDNIGDSRDSDGGDGAGDDGRDEERERGGDRTTSNTDVNEQTDDGSGGNRDLGGDQGDSGAAWPGSGDDALNDAVSDALGKGLNDLSAADEAALLAALTDLEDPDSRQRDQIRRLLDKLLKDGNGYLYTQYLEDREQEYVSAGAVDRNRDEAGYRYVTRNGETLSKINSSGSLVFTVGEKEYIRVNGSKKKLTLPAVSQADPLITPGSVRKYLYIPRIDAEGLIGCSCVYVPGTDVAILITDAMQNERKKLSDAVAGMR
ncbi:MAG: hypothetical protein II800_00135 [Lachnospiraceae bacterium]|nr:hypothetical protein [Lachnospiraceae bacterium]